MINTLESLGYIYDPINGIWNSQSYLGINYSDGDEVEMRLAEIIAQANDISVLSTELRQHCTDWVTLYHLSGTRANILRPFSHLLKGDVLEIGAGCGAITRYIGECGGNVLALEGSPRRAAIARSRTRDLANVTVLAEKFDDFQCGYKFDVITLIGVLEYANLFTTGEFPTLSMLQRVKSLLKPDGKLIIAIENQLGLKYFAGAPEDHLGIPMYGIEGRYRRNQPQTFGRKVLSKILMQSGFKHSEFLAAFPDYKLPVSILTRAGLNCENFDASAFAWQSVRRDPQLPVYSNFSLELSWPEVFHNQLALDVANSFLVIASLNSQALIKREILAYHYTTERCAEYCKAAVFKHEGVDEINIYYSRLNDATNTAATASKYLNFICPETDRYSFGTPLSFDFIKIVTVDGYRVEQVAKFVTRYLDILEKIAKERGKNISLISADIKLPGQFFDIIPQNIIIKRDSNFVVIDKEWELKDEIDLGHLLFRSLLSLILLVSRFGKCANVEQITRLQFMDLVLAQLGFALSADDYQQYADLEAKFQEQVSGRPVSYFENWSPNIDLPILSIYSKVQQNEDRDALIVERDAQIVERDAQIVERDAQLVERDAQIVERDAQIEALKNLVVLYATSNSWKITQPLRNLGQWVQKLRKYYNYYNL